MGYYISKPVCQIGRMGQYGSHGELSALLSEHLHNCNHYIYSVYWSNQ